MHLICPPKFGIAFVFHFSWVLQPFQEKLKTMLMQNFGEAIKVHYGRCASGVCEGIQDSLGSRSHAGDFGFFVRRTWIADSYRYWNCGFLELYSRFQSPGFSIPQQNLLDIGIPQAKISRDPKSGFPYMGWPKHAKWNENLHFIPLDEKMSIRAFSLEYVLLLHVFSCSLCLLYKKKCTFTCGLTAFLYSCIMFF